MNFTTTVKSALREKVPTLVQTLQSWPWADTLRTLRLRFREDHLGVTASSLTFTTLISLVPLVTVMLAVFSVFPIFANFQDALQKYFLQTLVPESISRPVLGALTQFAGKAKGVGGAGLVLLVFAAFALMLTIDRSLNAIWRVRTPRPIAQRVLVYWAAATLGPLVLGTSLSLTSYAISASRGVVGALPGGVALLFALLEIALLVTGMTALFRYVPNTHVRWRHALAGAVASAIGFEIVKRAFGWFLIAVPTYPMVYGAFAFLPIFLIWMYLAWVIVLLGAVIAAYAPSLQMRVKRWPDSPGARLTLALSVIRELATARAADGRGISGDRLAQSLRTDPLQIEPILDTLVGFDWVGRLDESGDPRFVLLCDPMRTLAVPLLSRWLLEPSAGSRGLWRRAGFDTATVADLLDA